jgi:O-antigen/teichoic acid export membrane protein
VKQLNLEKRTEIANIMLIWISKISAIIFSLVSVPIIISKYGLAVGGIWSIMNQISSAINLLDSGLSNGATRLLAKEYSKSNCNNCAKANAIFSTICFILTVIGLSIITISAGLFFIYIIAGVKKTNSQINVLKQLVAVGILTGMSLPFRLGQSLFASKSQFYISKLIESIFILVKTSGLYLFVVVLNLGLPFAVSFVYTIPVIAGMTTLGFGVFIYKYIQIDLRCISRDYINEIKNFSISSLLISLSAFLFYQTPAFLTAIELDFDSVASLNYPIMIYLVASNLMSAFQMTLTPRVAKFSIQSDWVILKNILCRSMRRYYIISLGAVVIFLISGKYALRLWLPQSRVADEIVHTIYVSTMLLLCANFSQCFSHMMLSVLLGAGDVMRVAVLETKIAIFAVSTYLGVKFLNGSNLHYIEAVCSVIFLKSFIIYPLHLKYYYKITIGELLRTVLTIAK